VSAMRRGDGLVGQELLALSLRLSSKISFSHSMSIMLTCLFIHHFFTSLLLYFFTYSFKFLMIHLLILFYLFILIAHLGLYVVLASY